METSHVLAGDGRCLPVNVSHVVPIKSEESPMRDSWSGIF